MASLEALNFKSVLRTDKEAQRVVFTSSHAVLYIFKNSQWERAEIEGTLLLYERREADWAFVILNRLHANNYRQLCSDIEGYQLDDGLLMFSTHSGSIFGLWIYSEEDKEQFCDWLDRILREKPSEDVVDEGPMVAICVPPTLVRNGQVAGQPREAGSGDLRTMLSRAVSKQSLLDQLFAAAATTPEKASGADSFYTDLAKQITMEHGPRLHLSQFKKIAMETLMQSDAFWEDLYGAYIEVRHTTPGPSS